jgi:hypothetical protein
MRVTVADVNGDKKPDIRDHGTSWSGSRTCRGRRTSCPTARRRRTTSRWRRTTSIATAADALSAPPKPSDTNGGGTLHWASPGGVGASWTLRDVTSEPTLHRIRWANVDGAGDPELIVAPLHGRGTSPPEWNGVGPRLLALHVPKDPARDPWPAELIDDSLHIVHNFAVLDFDGDGDDELIAASREGLHLLERGADGRWTKTRSATSTPAR